MAYLRGPRDAETYRNQYLENLTLRKDLTQMNFDANDFGLGLTLSKDARMELATKAANARAMVPGATGNSTIAFGEQITKQALLTKLLQPIICDGSAMNVGKKLGNDLPFVLGHLKEIMDYINKQFPDVHNNRIPEILFIQMAKKFKNTINKTKEITNQLYNTREIVKPLNSYIKQDGHVFTAMTYSKIEDLIALCSHGYPKAAGLLKSKLEVMKEVDNRIKIIVKALDGRADAGPQIALLSDGMEYLPTDQQIKKAMNTAIKTFFTASNVQEAIRTIDMSNQLNFIALMLNDLTHETIPVQSEPHTMTFRKEVPMSTVNQGKIDPSTISYMRMMDEFHHYDILPMMTDKEVQQVTSIRSDPSTFHQAEMEVADAAAEENNIQNGQEVGGVQQAHRPIVLPQREVGPTGAAGGAQPVLPPSFKKTRRSVDKHLIRSRLRSGREYGKGLGSKAALGMVHFGRDYAMSHHFPNNMRQMQAPPPPTGRKPLAMTEYRHHIIPETRPHHRLVYPGSTHLQTPDTAKMLDFYKPKQNLDFLNSNDAIMLSEYGYGPDNGVSLEDQQKTKENEDSKAAGTGIRRGQRYVPFGKYKLNHPALRKNKLVMRSIRGGQITSLPSKKISPQMADAIDNMLRGECKGFDNLPDEEKYYLRKLASTCELDNRIAIPAPKKSYEDRESDELEVLIGEVKAGNDNPDLLKKLKQSIMQLQKDHKIDSDKASGILQELASMGI
jgi:hypothetical protein